MEWMRSKSATPNTIGGGLITVSGTTGKRIAIIGGGLTGTSAAIHLSSSNALIDLYDWGRQPGGRSATRNLYIDAQSRETFVPPGINLNFNHGMQFIKTNDSAFIKSLRAVGAVEWKPKSGWLSQGQYYPHGSMEATKLGKGFFDILDDTKTFIAPQGMSNLCADLQKKEVASTGRVRIHQQVRVVGIHRTANNSWMLEIDQGHHEQTAETLASTDLAAIAMPVYDAVIFTEHMMWLPSWHPCSLRGLDTICPDARDWVRRHLCYDSATRRFERVAPLFTLMVAFEGNGVGNKIETACVNDEDNVLQYIVNQKCRSDSGTGNNDNKNSTTTTTNNNNTTNNKKQNNNSSSKNETNHGSKTENNSKNQDKNQKQSQCWVIVSTPSFAKQCLAKETMSKESDRNDASNGNIVYVPQEEQYLRKDPAELMLNSFFKAMGFSKDDIRPTILYKRCQRWGGAYTTNSTNADEKDNGVSRDRFDGSLINHGDAWEICTPSLTNSHILESGSGLWCAGDYIYPTTTASSSSQKKNRSTCISMEPHEIEYVKTLIDTYGSDFKSMAKDTSINTRQLTMGRIEKLCNQYTVWCWESQATKVRTEKKISSTRKKLKQPVSNIRHVGRAWNSGRSTAARVVRSLGLTMAPIQCLEICCDSIESVIAAVNGGCHRIELCSALGVGGLTPSIGLLRQVHTYIDGRIPIHVLIRPREGDFCYNAIEVSTMLDDIEMVAEHGASGVVLGTLTTKGDVDVDTTSALIQCAKQHGLSVTYHRAIDVSRDIMMSLDRCIEMGVDRILTSGGASNVMKGKATILKMIERVRSTSINKDLVIMAGAGLSESNVKELIQSTKGLYEIHGSLRSEQQSGMVEYQSDVSMGSNDQIRLICDVVRVQKVLDLFLTAR